MEPETHRLDREAMLADRRRVAERVGREVDEAVAAAAELRRAHFERFLGQMRADALVRQDLEATLRAAATTDLPADNEPS